MRGVGYLPREKDFFPNTRRGHGSTHPNDRVKKIEGRWVTVRQGNKCVDPTCQLHQPGSKNVHEDQRANKKDWEVERGLDRR